MRTGGLWIPAPQSVRASAGPDNPLTGLSPFADPPSTPRTILRRINLSATAIVLICFFLPWEQVSCGGASDSLTGFDLARHDSVLLWLIPLLMAAVLILGLLRRTGEKQQPFAILSAVAGGITLFLMNDQRSKIDDAATLIPARLTGWFWLGFISAAAMVATAVGLLLKRNRPAAGP